MTQGRRPRGARETSPPTASGCCWWCGDRRWLRRTPGRLGQRRADQTPILVVKPHQISSWHSEKTCDYAELPEERTTRSNGSHANIGIRRIMCRSRCRKAKNAPRNLRLLAHPHHTGQVLHRRSYLTSACNHGHRATDAIHNALTGSRWMPPLPAWHKDQLMSTPVNGPPCNDHPVCCRAPPIMAAGELAPAAGEDVPTSEGWPLPRRSASRAPSGSESIGDDVVSRCRDRGHAFRRGGTGTGIRSARTQPFSEVRPRFRVKMQILYHL
jgi:hypothetical protein